MIPATRSRPRSPRQQQLLGQMADVFLAEGFAHLSVEDLAVRLKASKTTLYAIGPSKEQLFTAVVRDFFRRATERVEATVGAESDPIRRIPTYLTAIAQALAPASAEFFADVDGLRPTREIYARNTQMAGIRVRELVRAAARPDRPVDATFLGAATAVVMEAIQQGRLRHLGALAEVAEPAAVGGDSFSDAAAYQALSDLILATLR